MLAMEGGPRRTIMKLPSRVKLVDVGPRDGLQNEKAEVPAAVKIELVHRLQDAGLTEIEVTSYVSPKWVPQMADNAEVMAGIKRKPGVRYSVLTPNMKGFEAAIAPPRELWPDEIVVFGAASEAFSQKNINCSIAESIERFRPVVEAAREKGIYVRGAMSCTVGCPYEGEIAPERVDMLAGLMKGIGVQHVGVADTIGVGTPLKVQRALDATSSTLTSTMSRAISMTPMARRWATRWLRCRWVCGNTTPHRRAWAAAPLPRAPPAMWPPKTWSTCCTAWALKPALTWTSSLMRENSSATSWAANRIPAPQRRF
jgi:hypothetical protein